MRFVWKDYCDDYQDMVEAFFDEEAKRFTGCDEGFQFFYEYWREELGADNFWCKVVFEKDVPIAVIAFAKASNENFTIQELAVLPACRGKGYGTAILVELLEKSQAVIEAAILTADAVIYPDNISSQKAFTKAGFMHTQIHPDGDAMYYRYTRC